MSRRSGDIQQLVAPAYLEVANANYGGADITLQSCGGVRIPLLGPVTAANVTEVLPFGNMLYRLEITGAEARGMVEDGLSGVYKTTGAALGPLPLHGRLAIRCGRPSGQGHLCDPSRGVQRHHRRLRAAVQRQNLSTVSTEFQRQRR